MADYSNKVPLDGAPPTGMPKAPGVNQSNYNKPMPSAVSTPPKMKTNYLNNNANYKTTNPAVATASAASTKINSGSASYTQTPKMESATDEDFTSDDSSDVGDDSTSTEPATYVDTNDTNVDVTQEAVMDVIKKSPDLITALESVGAMYCIPSTNMVCDNRLKSIRVVGDCVNAPDTKNVSGNAKAIMCAIGSVLDYISQRIDTKLDEYQKHNIDINRNKEINMLNDMGKHQYHVDPPKKSYFGDIEDITSGMNEVIMDNTISKCNDIASDIQESADLFEMYVNNGCNCNMGYTILQEQGFDYVKPTNKVFTESSKVSDKSKKIMPGDIKYMKFDNTNIIKAIKYINEARAEQAENKPGHVDLKRFMSQDSFEKALDCLNKQFDSRIQIRFIDDKDDSSEFTINFGDIKKNLSISKAKGFQLNKMPVIIFLVGKAIDCDAPDDIELFGQSFVSAILHELFHNISMVFAQSSVEFSSSLNTTLAIAGSIKKGKEKRIFITNYVNTLDKYFESSLSRLEKRILVKRFTTLTSAMYNNKALDAVKNSISEATSESDFDRMISIYENAVKREMSKRSPAGIIGCTVITALGIIGGIFLTKKLSSDVKKCVLGAITGLGGLSILGSGLSYSAFKSLDNKYKNSKEMEEYYCDLFAGMYSLPVTFTYSSFRKCTGLTADQLGESRLKRFNDIERDLYELIYSKYPTETERNHAAVKIAKNVLESDDDVDPSIKKYLQWIVDNFSSTLNIDIDEIYNTTTFDPKEAEDLDLHLDNLIDNNTKSITLTESYIVKILSSDKHISE